MPRTRTHAAAAVNSGAAAAYTANESVELVDAIDVEGYDRGTITNPSASELTSFEFWTSADDETYTLAGTLALAEDNTAAIPAGVFPTKYLKIVADGAAGITHNLQRQIEADGAAFGSVAVPTGETLTTLTVFSTHDGEEWFQAGDALTVEAGKIYAIPDAAFPCTALKFESDADGHIQIRLMD